MWKKVKKTFFSSNEDTPNPETDDAENSAKELYYRSDRFFYQSSLVNKNGSSRKDGWYFMLRGGETRGPFPGKEQALSALKIIIEKHQETGFTGR